MFHIDSFQDLLVAIVPAVLSGCWRHEPIGVHEELPAELSADWGRRAAPPRRQTSCADPNTDETIRYVVPEGWSPTEVSGLRRVAFQDQEGPLAVEMTAMGLPGSATQLLPNVNLWRKQIGLEEITQEDLDAAFKAIEVDGRRGHYVTLLGPADTERPLAMWLS